ncbi:MAG TPA: hypothetical protein VLF69_05420 [Candidatus Saccharimonadales bacterium]|nr:hypothetical protein [Candidatus Saccharimonadales bacterium]
MIDPKRYGVSFSLKQCRDLGIDQHDTLAWLIEQGWRRFRLMSYWNEHEKQPGKYDFSALDVQIAQIRKARGIITLCLGARQPRWPENHWPDWAWNAPKQERTEALLHYIEQVVNRYKNELCIVSYQLENEALFKLFGKRPEIDRSRLRTEFGLVKQLDPKRPVIMSVSDPWGIPLIGPIPDIVGFSYYAVLWNAPVHRYTTAGMSVIWHRARARLIRWLLHRPTYIHELQCEPWGPQPIWDMLTTEQDKSMNVEQIKQNIRAGQKTHLYPIDLWGGEWWYWRHKQGDDSIWEAVQHSLQEL